MKRKIHLKVIFHNTANAINLPYKPAKIIHPHNKFYIEINCKIHIRKRVQVH